jgi:hypothetical protein
MRARRAESSRRLTLLALVASYSSQRRPGLQGRRLSILSLSFAWASGRGPSPRLAVV